MFMYQFAPGMFAIALLVLALFLIWHVLLLGRRMLSNAWFELQLQWRRLKDAWVELKHELRQWRKD